MVGQEDVTEVLNIDLLGQLLLALEDVVLRFKLKDLIFSLGVSNNFHVSSVLLHLNYLLNLLIHRCNRIEVSIDDIEMDK